MTCLLVQPDRYRQPDGDELQQSNLYFTKTKIILIKLYYDSNH